MIPLRRERLLALFEADGRARAEREDLVTLMLLASTLPSPPDPMGLMPRYDDYREAFVEAAHGADWEATEEAFLTLYAHLHGHDAPYTALERRRVDETGGYWNHAGGIAPVTRAGPFIRPDSVSADLGAGNGLQLLLLQRLHPHSLSIMVEISSVMVRVGRLLQGWLGIDDARVRWRVADVMDERLTGVDFLYMYRPVRPEGPGVRFYERLARDLSEADREVVVFSIADCLRAFALPGHDVLFSDGHLTCLRFPGRRGR